MRTKYLPTRVLFAGILSIAVGGCSSSNTDDDGTGETTGGAEATGGVAAGGSGGSATTGGTGQPVTGGTTSAGGGTEQPVTGGTTGTGGSTEQPMTGGMTGDGGATASGGSQDTGGQATGGRSGIGGRTGRGGAGTGGSTADGTGGAAAASGSGGVETGGNTGNGGEPTGGTSNGGSTAGGTTGTGGAATGGSTGPCTASKDAGRTVSGSGPHKVVIETNSDPGINCGTIYRPEDLGGDEKYPIFVWGEGACTRNGSSNQAAMGEIASWGYFVVADGPPGGGGNCSSIGMSSDVAGMAKPLLDYITWAIAENGKTCSAYNNSLDTTKVAADGFSCGGLMAEGTAGDPRMTTWGVTSSGLTSPNQSLYQSIHTPVKILVGGSGDVAYENGKRDYENIAPLGIPVIFLSKDSGGHGGDLNNGKGDFNTINLAWLNWQLKGDEGATGKGLLYGSSCKYCTASGWEYESANIE
jgi:hypothetical protein